ncbi:MAG: WD40/YVTN/BNR-like repeat-containing protein [Gemmataceae bacterium]
MLYVLLLLAADEPRLPKALKPLEFRNIGPAMGGRVCRACGVPGDPLTYYAATAAGGVWKSTDGGVRWGPVFDKTGTTATGSLAVAPSDPNVVYVGSGEANIRGNVEVGSGLYRSTDAGKTWSHVWKQEGQVGQLAVHPKDADTAFAAVFGKAFGPNPERGVYRTTDGGKSWKQVLKKDDDTGASAVVVDPNNPRVVFAGLWQARRRPWEMTSGGPGSGLHVSRDGGDTWTQLVAPPEEADDKEPAKGTKHAKGLPKGVWGRVGLAIAPSDGKRVYALIEAEEGGLFRSDDGGDTWDRVNKHKVLRQRAWYYSTLTVHPKNPDVVLFPQVPLIRSTDGGKTLHQVKLAFHGDNHDAWFDPANPDRIIVANDGGVNLTTDGGKTWYAPPLPLCQFYRISVDSRTPYRISGTIQDIGTAQGPSHSLLSSGIPLSSWYGVGGGEAGHTTSDPKDPDVVFATEYGGYVSRYDHRTRQARPVPIYPFNNSGHGADVLKYRFQWTAPVLASKHEDGVVYHAANVLFKSADGGKTWKPVSPDLSRNDRTKMKWSGGPITGDNTGVEIYGTIFALAEGPEKGTLWAGTDDGRVHVSGDGGARWDDVTPKGLPTWATVIGIEPSPHDPKAAYLVAENRRNDDRKPYLWVTRDRGKTWDPLTAGLPETGWLCVVREDPKKKGLLFLGAERGLFYSADGGVKWEPFTLNLPPVRVSDIRITDEDLVVGTNGRSIWVLDDLSPVRDAKAWEGRTALLPPRPAVRWRQADVTDPVAPMSVYPNPPAGAVLHYHLAAVPKGDVTLEVLDAKGAVIRTLTSKKPPESDTALEASWSQFKEPDPLPKSAGLHRVVWDLRHEGATVIPGARIDAGQPRTGFLVAPGVYGVRLTADGKSEAAKLEVKPDPRLTPAEVAELAAQQALALQVRDDITALSKSVIALRAVRDQLKAREKLLAKDDRPEVKKLTETSSALVKKLDELEERFHNPKAEVTYDILAMKGGAKVYSQLSWLHALLTSADGAPAQGVTDVHREQAAVLKGCQDGWQALVKEVAALNEKARTLDVPGVIVPR